MQLFLTQYPNHRPQKFRHLMWQSLFYPGLQTKWASEIATTASTTNRQVLSGSTKKHHEQESLHDQQHQGMEIRRRDIPQWNQKCSKGWWMETVWRSWCFYCGKSTRMIFVWSNHSLSKGIVLSLHSKNKEKSVMWAVDCDSTQSQDYERSSSAEV